MEFVSKIIPTREEVINVVLKRILKNSQKNT